METAKITDLQGYEFTNGALVNLHPTITPPWVFNAKKEMAAAAVSNANPTNNLEVGRPLSKHEQLLRDIAAVSRVQFNMRETYLQENLMGEPSSTRYLDDMDRMAV